MKPHKVVVPRKNEKTGKTYWTRIGSAFPRDNGGMSIVLDALPIGNEIMIFPPDADDAPRGGGRTQGGDDVPY